ncbi:MAG: chorismate synthase [Victivallaceae bacterium]
MTSNTFGRLFRVTTWGESHGKAIGVVIDGCPSGIKIDEKDIYSALQKRAPGKNRLTSSRQESDYPEILSGVFEGKTTGTPISIIIKNQDVIEDRYSALKDVLRPGHANYSYLKKYGIFDHRGGGRASGRETACRVAAGAIADKILKRYSIKIVAYLQQVGDCICPPTEEDITSLKTKISDSSIFCPDNHTARQITETLENIKTNGDSIGGIVTFKTSPLPYGLGSPIYEKLEAVLASGLMSIPGSKGFEIGSGFLSARMKGSEHNDLFLLNNGRIITATNHAGGVLGGISFGMPLTGNVVFKPTSSIGLEQTTLTTDSKPTVLKISSLSKHDPCIAVRAVPVVEAMVSLVLVDALLINKSIQR